MRKRIGAKEAMSEIRTYLREHFLAFHEDVEGTDRITMVFKDCDQCPDKVTEGCIYFYPDYMECRVYYSATGAKWCANSIDRSDFFRLLNYINAKVWPCGADGDGGSLYKPAHLFAPRLYMTEDGCYDITMTTVIPYDFFVVAPLETEDFFTASLPELMNALSLPIFLVLLGKITLDDAIQIIDRDILGNEV